jgi:hypothetical protein
VAVDADVDEEWNGQDRLDVDVNVYWLISQDEALAALTLIYFGLRLELGVDVDVYFTVDLVN